MRLLEISIDVKEHEIRRFRLGGRIMAQSALVIAKAREPARADPQELFRSEVLAERQTPLLGKVLLEPQGIARASRRNFGCARRRRGGFPGFRLLCAQGAPQRRAGSDAGHRADRGPPGRRRDRHLRQRGRERQKGNATDCVVLGNAERGACIDAGRDRPPHHQPARQHGRESARPGRPVRSTGRRSAKAARRA